MATFENVRTNQLSTQGTAWFQEVLRVIETMWTPTPTSRRCPTTLSWS